MSSPQNSHTFLSDVLDLMLDAVCVVDREGRFRFVNGAFERIFGYAPRDVLDRPMLELVHPDDRQQTLGVVDDIHAGELVPGFENRWVHKSGRIVNVMWSARWSDKYQVRIAVGRDITEIKRAREQMQMQLEYLATHDPLTDLPNRVLFLDRLKMALARENRERSGLALMFVDLDSFKTVNDTYGHAVGDALLRQVAARLKRCVRSSDSIGRLGGDEFVALITYLANEADVHVVAEKMRGVLSAPYDVDGTLISISPSIGVACRASHDDSFQELLQSADDAMYQAKRGGGNRFVVQ